MKKLGFVVALAAVLGVAQGAFALGGAFSGVPANTPLKFTVQGVNIGMLYNDLPNVGDIVFDPTGGVGGILSTELSSDTSIKNHPTTRFDVFGAGAGIVEDSWGVFEITKITNLAGSVTFYDTGSSSLNFGRELFGFFYNELDVGIRQGLGAGDQRIFTRHGKVAIFDNPDGTFASFFPGLFTNSGYDPEAARKGYFSFPGVNADKSGTIFNSTPVLTGSFQSGWPLTSDLPGKAGSDAVISLAADFNTLTLTGSSSFAFDMDTIPTKSDGSTMVTGFGNFFFDSSKVASPDLKQFADFGSKSFGLVDPTSSGFGPQPPKWTSTFTDATIFTNTTPEPSTIVLTGIGLLGLAVAFRKRRAK